MGRGAEFAIQEGVRLIDGNDQVTEISPSIACCIFYPVPSFLLTDFSFFRVEGYVRKCNETRREHGKESDGVAGQFAWRFAIAFFWSFVGGCIGPFVFMFFREGAILLDRQSITFAAIFAGVMVFFLIHSLVSYLALDALYISIAVTRSDGRSANLLDADRHVVTTASKILRLSFVSFIVFVSTLIPVLSWLLLESRKSPESGLFYSLCIECYVGAAVVAFAYLWTSGFCGWMNQIRTCDKKKGGGTGSTSFENDREDAPIA